MSLLNIALPTHDVPMLPSHLSPGRGQKGTPQDANRQNIMTRPNITPGPWGQDEELPFYVITKEGQTVCEAVAGDQVTDARVIAALPDLLSALEGTAASLDILWKRQNGDTKNYALERAEAALIKAGYTFP